MINIPAIPMVKILKQYAASKGLPLNPKNWESIMRVYEMYILYVQNLN